MLDRIIFNSSKYEGYSVLHKTDEFKSNELTTLSRLNIFIGENNSGKSRFLRTLFSDNNFELNIKNSDIVGIPKLISESYNLLYDKFAHFGIAHNNNILKTLEDLKKYSTFTTTNINEQIKSIETFLNSIKDYVYINQSLGYIFQSLRSSHGENFVGQIINYIIEFAENFSMKLKKHIPSAFIWNYANIYIPILRGLRPINIHESKFTNSDNYNFRTTTDYFKGEKNIRNDIYTGLQLYEDIRKHLLDRRDKRDKIRRFEEFLSKTFFSNKLVSLIPNHGHDVINIGIGDEEERAIYDLGDGIQSIITILYPLFLNQDKNLLVFIEEPEISLHPGMQRILVEALLSDDFKNFQYFITTHSNHLLDITLDLENISVYTFQKKHDAEGKATFEIQNTSNDDLSILDLIGARNSSVFLSNCTIWVEGITDRLYLRKYLSVYQDSLLKEERIQNTYKEDIHFSFIEYGGGNIVHFSFSDTEAWDKIKASRISNKIFLIADQDNTLSDPTSEKAERLRQFEKNLGPNFRPVDGREIENTLSPKVLIKTIKKIQGSSNKNLKYDEKEITIEKYKNEKIGAFITANFLHTSRNYEADSGTLNQKVNFCQTAIEQINSVEDLSEEGLALAKDIFEFIKRNN